MWTVWVLFSPMVGGWVDVLWEKVCLGCISETVRCRKLKFGRGIGWGCKFASSWYDIDLTFNLARVTLSLKILCGLILRNCKLILGRDTG